jgi:Holliday junction resolvase RusA-like endonuclease
MKIELEFQVEPLAVQSARFRRVGKFIRSYQPERNTDWKRAVRLMARSQLPPGFIPADVPLRVEIDFVFAPLKSMSRKTVQTISSGGIVYKSTRGDLDNYTKPLFDALSGTVWNDDAVVCELLNRKRYGTASFIRLSAVEL